MSNNNFVKDNLLPNEQIIATAKWHWMKNMSASFVLLAVCLVLLIITYSEAKTVKNDQIQYFREAQIHEAFVGNNNSALTAKDFLEVTQMMSPWEYWDSTTAGPFVIICFVLVIVVYFISIILNKYDEFAITNLRVVAKVGMIRRIAFELHNEQVESIEIRQGILGRLMGFGTLIPGGVGASKVRIAFVKDPYEFRQHFYDLKKGKQQTIE